jgi:hypothetical protein
VISKEVTMSEQERVSWVSLVVSVVIGYWYFERIFGLPASADVFGPRTAAFATRLILLAVFIAIASEVVLRIVQKHSRNGAGADATARDERDELINLKASRNAYGVLSSAVIIVLAQVALIEWAQRYRHRRSDPETILELIATGPLAPMHIAQLLLLALTLGGITVYASRIFHYRRGY